MALKHLALVAFWSACLEIANFVQSCFVSSASNYIELAAVQIRK